MSVFNRFSTTDRAILGGSFLILLLLSYFLYDDSFLFPTIHHDQPAIGSLSTSENDVRLKNAGNFIWLPGSKKSEIFNRDSIFTGDRSQASVTLLDGSQILIQENSLVNLNISNGQMQLDLRFGQLSAKTPLLVRSGNDEYVLNGKDTQFEINRTSNGTLDVKVFSGNLEIKGKKGTQSLKSNESLQITEKTEEKYDVEPKIRIVTKNDIIMYRTNEHEALPFEWEGNGPLRQYQIEVSKTADFKKISALKTISDQSVLLKNALNEGNYFWRVKGMNNQRKTLVISETQKFYLSYMSAPKVLIPENKSTLRSTVMPSVDGLKVTARISWEGDPRFQSFEWQLSKDENFKENLEYKSLKTKQIDAAGLFQGTYHTRVRGFDSDKHPSPWSNSHVFNVEITAEEKPPAPQLTEQHIRFQIPKNENRAPSAENSPQMAWSSVKVAKEYHWEIAKNARFIGAQKSDIPSTRIAWTQYKPGKYYYRVFARSALGQISAPSETGVLEVFGDRPEIVQIPPVLVKETNLDAVAPAKEIQIKWTPIPDAKSYALEFDKNADFSAPVQIEAASNASKVTLSEPGKYFVRVKALNESAADMSEFSNLEEVNYIYRKSLKMPVLVEPFDKTTVFLQKDMEPFIWLEWESVDRAEKYQLEASISADFAKPILQKELTETRFLIKEKMPYGRLFWRVRAVPAADREPASGRGESSDWATREFILYHQRNRGF